MIEDPDTRPRLTERRMFCASIVVLLLVLIVGIVVGLFTWYRGETSKAAALMSSEQLWQSRLSECQLDRWLSQTHLKAIASRIGCVFEHGSPYQQAVQQALSDANSRQGVGRPSLQVAAPAANGTHGRPPPLGNITMASGNFSLATGSLAAVQELYRSGVRLFIGFPNSDDLFTVVQWARQHAPDAVLVSPSATATDLYSASGSPLLLSMGDSALAVALLCLLRERRVRHLVPVVADNTYGRSLLEELRRAAMYEGAWTQVAEPTLYQPALMSDEDERWSVLLSARDSLRRLRRTDAAAAGLLFVSGAEMRHFLEAGGWDEQLAAVPWFGADSVALRRDILATEVARAAAVRVRLTALIYAGADASNAAQQWDVLRRLRSSAHETPPNVLRAYDGAALLAELGHLVMGHGDTSSALSALRAVARSGATGAATVDDGSSRAGGRFAVTRVVARVDASRHLLADTGADALWVVVGQVRLEADPQQGMYLSRAVLSAAGSAFHLVRRPDVAALYAAVGGCRGDSLQLTAVQPTGDSAVSAAYQLIELPDRLLVPASHPVRLQLHCSHSDSGLMHMAIRCPGVPLPGADTVFCLAETYRLVESNSLEVATAGVRWQHERHLVRCGAVTADCLDQQCEDEGSCISSLTDELAGWPGQHEVK